MPITPVSIEAYVPAPRSAFRPGTIPRVGSPDVDPISADAHAHEVLEAFAPTRS